MNKQMWAFVKRALGVGAVLAMVAVASGCSESVTGTATAAGGAEVTTSSSVPTPRGGDEDGSSGLDIGIGDCVRLGGTADAATVAEADCGSMESNYVVVAKESDSARCPSDVDQVYYETGWGGEVGALCLDVDWVLGGCMSLPDGEDEPQRVDCDDPHAPAIERAVEIVQGVTGVERCSEGGFVHAERRFTVCTETVRPL